MPLSPPAFAACAAALLLLTSGTASAQPPAGRDAPTEIDRLLEARSVRAVAEAPADPSGPVCLLPPPERGESVVLFNAYQGGALSSAAVAGPDAPTTHAFVDIEPGRGPLYLVLSAHAPTVWSFRGATGRLARAVLLTPSGAGAVGLSPERVQVLNDGACGFDFDDAASPEAAQARAGLRRAIGREAVTVAGAYSVGAVSLPSGRVTTPRQEAVPAAVPPPGFDAEGWRNALRSNAGGLVTVDPAAVVGATAQAYDVLPGPFGLAQLVGSGALQRLGGRDYRVAAPIARWPSGLAGAGSVRFLLGRGVPYPAGSPGHSCVVSEATGAPVSAAEPGSGADSAESRAARAELLCGR